MHMLLPETVGVVRFSVAPAHIGPLLAAVGVEGIALTTAVVVPAILVHPFNSYGHIICPGSS